MIHGVGVDLVEIDRIRALLERHGPRLTRRILAPEEIEELGRGQRPASFVAKRFAAKEAVAKALGIGFRNGLRFRDIRVCHDAWGRPGLAYAGRAAEIIAEFGIAESHLSLSDERHHALAFVTLVRAG